MKTPNIKHQTPDKLQTSTSNPTRSRWDDPLVFGSWCLPGVWVLGFGACLDFGFWDLDFFAP
jgi:hypothetical protein